MLTPDPNNAIHRFTALFLTQTGLIQYVRIRYTMKYSERTPSAPRTLFSPLRGSRLFRLPQERFQDVGIAAQKKKERSKRRTKNSAPEELLGVLMFLTRVVVSSGSSQDQLSTRPAFPHTPLGGTREIK